MGCVLGIGRRFGFCWLVVCGYWKGLGLIIIIIFIILNVIIFKKVVFKKFKISNRNIFFVY